jgi:hypothetical protein
VLSAGIPGFLTAVCRRFSQFLQTHAGIYLNLVTTVSFQFTIYQSRTILRCIYWDAHSVVNKSPRNQVLVSWVVHPARVCWYHCSGRTWCPPLVDRGVKTTRLCNPQGHNLNSQRPGMSKHTRMLRHLGCIIAAGFPLRRSGSSLGQV